MEAQEQMKQLIAARTAVHKVITSATIINLLSEEFSVVISDHSF
jgi:hypothetical protein